jgi:alkylation response protein AidB-like acyl-CoA dehydrogenase
MNYFLTEEQQAIIETAREIAEKKIKPVREKHDADESFPWEVVEELRKADLFGVYFHPNYGGLGGAGFELVLVVEELSKACGGIALALAATALGTFPIILFGTPAQKKNGCRTSPAASDSAPSPSPNRKRVPTRRPPVARRKKTGISTF